jgi:hypothetical protein
MRDEETMEKLKKAVQLAYSMGSCHLIVSANSPPPRQEKLLRETMDYFKGRAGALLYTEESNELMRRAEQWLTTLAAERKILRVIEDVRPDLRTAANPSFTKPKPQKQPWEWTNDVEIPPFDYPGPWLSTLNGQTCEGVVKDQLWYRIESLTDAIKVARADGASEALCVQAATVRQGLVARTKELPADRVVLDPEGEGLKLLPPGTQRAISGMTGDAYSYMVNFPNEVGQFELPCTREELVDVAVDDCRPVCSIYVEKRKCHLGRRCPWRHCMPMPGDTIREPVKLEDV